MPQITKIKNHIAIVGAACRFPGEANSLDAFWTLLESGRDAVTKLPEDRFCLQRFVSKAKNLDGYSYTSAAGIIGKVKDFDPDFFGISRKEAIDMDPQQRIILETTWEAFETANIVPSSLKGSGVGVFIGASNVDNSLRGTDDPATMTAYSMIGSNLSIISNRVSYLFDFHGPSLTVDTACSSSLVAVHLACEELRSGKIPLAVAGGVNILMTPYPYIGFSRAKMLSPDGRCKAFDASGNGYVRSEGAGVVLLKPLQTALDDGDTILGIIAGSGVNSDGRTTGLSLPNPKAQADLLKNVYNTFQLDKKNIVYTEAHGTGTAAGDPLEAHAIGNVLGASIKGRCLLMGSVKSNIGHLESASGIAGLIKSLLIFKHGKVPPNLHFITPNPAIDFDGLNITVPTKTMPLPRIKGKKLISINSFGFGGTNAHIVLQAPPPKRTSRKTTEQALAVPPLFLSARSQDSLVTMAGRYAKYLSVETGASLYDVAASTAYGREKMPWRAAITGEATSGIITSLHEFVANPPSRSPVNHLLSSESYGKGVFCYSGNGSQWLGMGQRLMTTNRVFRETIEEVDSIISPMQGWQLLEFFTAPGKYAEQFDYAEKSQPTLFAMQVGITRALAARGIYPAAVMGHSAGEVAASWACGALSLKDACTLAIARSVLQAPLRGTGNMAVANTAPEQAATLIEHLGLSIEITAINTWKSLTVAGQVEELQSFVKACKAKRIAAKMLSIPYPFHTRAMDGQKAALLESLKNIAPRKPKVAFYSTAAGEIVKSRLDAQYWFDNMRKPVLFAQAFEQSYDDGYRLFMEIGPSPVLRSYMRDLLKQKNEPTDIFITLSNNDREDADLENTWKDAWQSGWEIDYKKFFPVRHNNVDLPLYPWTRETLWADQTPETRGVLRDSRVHPLLGWALPGNTPVFENTLLPADFPWLADHVAGFNIVYPAAAFLESMLAAAVHVFPDATPTLERVALFKPLTLSEQTAKNTKISVDKEDGGLSFEARSHMSDEPWGKFARARLVHGGKSKAPAISTFNNPESFGIRVENATLYKTASRYLLHYGPAFRTVENAWLRHDNAKIEVLAQLAEPIMGSGDGMLIPPPLIDGALQTLFIILEAQKNFKNQSFLPSAFERVRLFAKGTPHFAHARLERVSPRSVVASFSLLDKDCTMLLELKNCRFRRAAWLEHEKTSSSPYRVALFPTPHPLQETSFCPGSMPVSRVTLPTYGKKEYKLHPSLLLQLTALSSAHETILSLAPNPAAGFSCTPASLVEEGGISPANQPWVTAMLEALEEAKLAHREGECWQVLPKNDRASATMLWRTLLSSAPDYLPEATLLSHIFKRHPALVKGAFDDNEEAILTEKLITDYYAGSFCLVEQKQEIKNHIQSVLLSAKDGDVVNVLHFAQAPQAIVTDMLPLLENKAVNYVVAEKNASATETRALAFGPIPLSFETVDPENPEDIHKGRYHVIILSWYLHTCLNNAAVLASCNEMLAPGGIIIVQEQAPTTFSTFTFGARPSWWSASPNEGQPVSLLQDREYWQKALTQAGFTLERHTGTDGNTPSFTLLGRKSQASITSLPASATGEKSDKKAVSPYRVIVFNAENEHSEKLSSALAGALPPGEGAAPLVASPIDEESQQQFWQEQIGEWGKNANGAALQVLFVAGYDTRQDTATEEFSRVQLSGLMALAGLSQAWNALRPAMNLVIVGGGALADSFPHARPVPSQGGMLGFTRVLANEMRGLTPLFVDLHGSHEDIPVLVPQLVRELLHPTGEPEVVLSGKFRYSPRLVPITPKENKPVNETEASAVKLGFDTPGRLQNLRWEFTRNPVPSADQVVVAVKCAGLNFRDVMWSMGMLLDEALENGFSGPGLGIECSGVVTAVGKGVQNVKAGDPVLCFASEGFSSHIVTTESAVLKLPTNVSFSEAATIPVAFMTAWYSMKHLARLQPGERILIHGGAGGVGLAAIQLARHLKLEVFVTAGSPEKQNFLRQLGVNNIYSSRTLDFAEEIMRSTNYEGVDAVLNSLAGEAIPAGLSVLRPFGRFLELGKRDFFADTPMRLRPFSNNISYFGIDVDQLLIHQPSLARELFSELLALFENKKLAPLPHTVYSAARVVDAFQSMQQASHIGKLVISLDGAAKLARPVPSSLRKLQLSPDGTYIVAGGTNGFGLATAERLVYRGARNLVLVSRSGLRGDRNLATVEKMRKAGATIIIAKADVSCKVSLESVFADTLRHLPPVRGVVHSAAVLADGIIAGLTSDGLKASLGAKVLGAYNLHQLTLDLPLDFFVLYSSATTPFGNPGQAAYVAANNTLESLAALRSSLGLPVQVIGWGAIGDTGMLTRNEKALEVLTKTIGITPTLTHDALDWLEHAIATQTDSSFFFGLDWQRKANLPVLTSPLFSLVRPKSHGCGEENSFSLEQVHTLPVKESINLIASILIMEISRIMGMPVDKLVPTTPLSSIGMDSLMAVELSLAIEQNFELASFNLNLSEKTTILSLAELLHKSICRDDGSGEIEEQKILKQVEQKHGIQLSEAAKNEIINNVKGKMNGQ